MITLAPYLKSRGGSTAGEREAEALNRIISVLLQGIALHGFNYEPAAFAAFEKSIRKLRADFDHVTDEATALLLTGAAIRRLEEHNAAAEQYLTARRNEEAAVVALLSETLLQVTKAGPETMVRVKEIERDISLATSIEEMAAARGRLEACLAVLREGSGAGKEASLPETGRGEAGTDPITGLPDARCATTAIAEIWHRRNDSHAAVLAPERIESINMRFGFQAGDQVLLFLGQHVARQLAAGDRLFRWRGPCLLLLMERPLPEAFVTAELGRLAPARVETALSFREREVLVPVSAAWTLFPLRGMSSPDELIQKLNEFAGSRSLGGRRTIAAAM